MPNRQLTAARQATPSPRVLNACMSRAELAETVNAWVDANTSTRGALDEHYIGRLEQGRVTWPRQHYRAGFRVVLGAATDADLGFAPSNRRPVSPLAAALGTGDVLTPDDADRIAYVASSPRRVDRSALESLAVVLAEQRRLEDAIGATPLIAPVRGWMAALESLVMEARGSLRPAVVDLAAQWSQFAGWLHAATDQVAVSDRLFSRTLEWAIETDNVTLQANALTFKGNIAWIAGRVGAMIGLSQAAQRDQRVYVGQLAFAAMQEARGHATTGDINACDQKMDDASLLAKRLAERVDDPPPWNYDTPALITLERGLVNCRLGRQQVAAELLTTGLAELPAEHRHAEWTGDYRRVLDQLSA